MMLPSDARIGFDQQARSPERIVSVRYEDLVLRPEQTLKQTLGPLGLSFVPAMLRYWEQAPRAPEWDLGSRNAAAFSSIEPERVFAYHRHVPDYAQRSAIAAHESEIVALGYAPGWDY